MISGFRFLAWKANTIQLGAVWVYGPASLCICVCDCAFACGVVGLLLCLLACLLVRVCLVVCSGLFDCLFACVSLCVCVCVRAYVCVCVIETKRNSDPGFPFPFLPLTWRLSKEVSSTEGCPFHVVLKGATETTIFWSPFNTWATVDVLNIAIKPTTNHLNVQGYLLFPTCNI